MLQLKYATMKKPTESVSDASVSNSDHSILNVWQSAKQRNAKVRRGSENPQGQRVKKGGEAANHRQRKARRGTHLPRRRRGHGRLPPWLRL